MLPVAASVQSIERLLASNLIEFLDLGCGAGGSNQYVRRYTDMRVGLSLDLSQVKIMQCRNVNDLSFAFDVSQLPRVPDSVSSAFCMHFLEHVDNAATVFQIIEAALMTTRDFLFVRQPYFDHDADLAGLGARTYWSDWSGHKTKLTREMIKALSERLRPRQILRSISIHGIDRIDHTSHPSVLPLGAPPDQHGYDTEAHGPKPLTPIDFDCFREIVIVFERNTISKAGLQNMRKLLASIESRATMLGEIDASYDGAAAA